MRKLLPPKEGWVVWCLVFGVCLILVTFFLRTTNYELPTIFAQTAGCATPQGTDLSRVSSGLVTTPNLGVGTQFYTSGGKCITDTSTVFVPFKIPTYDELKSVYFTQGSSITSTKTTLTPVTSPGATQADIPFNSATGYNLYNITGTYNNLTIGANNSGTGSGVVFVDGYLNITSNYTYGGANSGTVLVASGNIYIESDVTRIDAVLIAGGRIYTATTPGTTNPCSPSSVNVSRLTINGSLISLTPASPIVFCRTLLSTNNTESAEIINQQPKYLVLLRNTFSQSLKKWSEIAEAVVIPSPPPLPTPTPTPIPTPAPPVLNVGTITSTSIALSWNAVTGATSYKLYRCFGGSACDPITGGGLIASGITVTSYTNTSLNCGASYYRYIVRATNAGGDSGNSNTTAALSTLACQTVPNPPTGVSAVGGNGQATVSWTPPASDGGSTILDYHVFSNPAAPVAISAASPAIVTGLTNGIPYTFNVAARNAIGLSDPSAPSNSVIPSTGSGNPNFDVASSAVTAGGTGAPSLNWSHTTANLPNRLLLVGISIKNSSSQSVSSVDYAGNLLTFAGAQSNGTNDRVELWYLKNPTPGANTVTVTMSSAVNFVAGATTWSSVNQITPLGSFVPTLGTSNNPSINVPSASGEVVVDVLGAGDTSSIAPIATIGPSQTQHWNAINSCGACPKVRGTSSRKAGASTVTMSWNLDVSKPWVIGAVSIKP